MFSFGIGHSCFWLVHITSVLYFLDYDDTNWFERNFGPFGHWQESGKLKILLKLELDFINIC